MKILFVTNNYKPYNAGLVSSLESFRYELQKQGHEVTLVTLDFTGAEYPESGVIRLRCPLRFNYKTNPIAIPFFVQGQLNEIFESVKPDIVHVHHPFGLGYSAAKCARKRNIPTVFTHHTQYGQYARHYAPVFPSLAQSFIERYVINFCQLVDAIVVPTESIKNQLEEKLFKKLLKIIPSGVLPVFSCTELPEKKRIKKHFSLLTVSRFVTEKNLPFLLHVIKKLDEKFTLTLVGYGRLYEELQDYAYNHLGLSHDRVVFVHNPPKTIIAQLYREADLFLFSSTTETQGIVFAESMAAGTPIVAVYAPGAQDCIKNGVNGFLVNTVDEMVERINQLDKQNELLQKLREGAWKTSQDFEPSRLARQLIQLYVHILE